MELMLYHALPEFQGPMHIVVNHHDLANQSIEDSEPQGLVRRIAELDLIDDHLLIEVRKQADFAMVIYTQPPEADHFLVRVLVRVYEAMAARILVAL